MGLREYAYGKACLQRKLRSTQSWAGLAVELADGLGLFDLEQVADHQVAG